MSKQGNRLLALTLWVGLTLAAATTSGQSSVDLNQYIRADTLDPLPPWAAIANARGAHYMRYGSLSMKSSDSAIFTDQSIPWSLRHTASDRYSYEEDARLLAWRESIGVNHLRTYGWKGYDTVRLLHVLLWISYRDTLNRPRWAVTVISRADSQVWLNQIVETYGIPVRVPGYTMGCDSIPVDSSWRQRRRVFDHAPSSEEIYTFLGDRQFRPRWGNEFYWWPYGFFSTMDFRYPRSDDDIWSVEFLQGGVRTRTWLAVTREVPTVFFPGPK